MEIKLQLLKDVKNPSIATLGGKGYSLYLLKKSGFNIPKTYVLDVNNINLLKVSKCDLLIDLAEGSYAVRSSGIVEDGKFFSYAGLFDTYLNVANKHLKETIFKCVNSISNDRLEAYEKTLTLTANPSMCVLIQEMIPAEISGICFTANPVSKNIDDIVIEYGIGLGDKIVGGEISPITVIYDKSTEEIKEKYLGEYSKTEFDAYEATMISLIKVCKQIKEIYTVELDIEWAMSNNQIVILQARPITGIYRMAD
jgi:phosphoenolpyruvate synthase/pyruvate phosphate dikinase